MANLQQDTKKKAIYKFFYNDSVATEFHNSLCLVHTTMVNCQISNGTEYLVMQIATTANIKYQSINFSVSLLVYASLHHAVRIVYADFSSQ